MLTKLCGQLTKSSLGTLEQLHDTSQQGLLLRLQIRCRGTVERLARERENLHGLIVYFFAEYLAAALHNHVPALVFVDRALELGLFHDFVKLFERFAAALSDL